MDIKLSAPAIRVLGCLMEKEMATPDYYPLSLNALVNACNQKTNRFPVVDYDAQTVAAAIDELKAHQFVFQSNVGRVAKYGENFVKVHNFIAPEAAVLALLFLRGPQTVGELRGRSERLHGFASLEEVQQTLDGLVELGLVRKMARQPGRKESRYIHLLADLPEEESGAAAVVDETPDPGILSVRSLGDRLTSLEEEVQSLRTELAALRQAFADFKSQFE